MLEQQIEQDLKTALLSRDSQKISVLRMIKSAILNYKVANSKRNVTLDDAIIVKLLAREAKQRQESADLYHRAGDDVRAKQELEEKDIVAEYLPKQLTDEELSKVIDVVISGCQNSSEKTLANIIKLTKEITMGTAEGGQIAKLAKEKLVL